MKIEKEYEDFVSEVWKRAKKYPKKHGNWGAVPLSDNRFLSMDTWNGEIHLKRGPIPECNYWVGFRDAETISYIGIKGGNVRVNDVGTMRDVMRELSQ